MNKKEYYFSLLSEIYSKNYQSQLKNDNSFLTNQLLEKVKHEKTILDCKELVEEWKQRNPQLLVE